MIHLRVLEQRLPDAPRESTGHLTARRFRVDDAAGVVNADEAAQYFLKWVISHPAVICALPASSNPEHARDNVLALQPLLKQLDERAYFRRQVPCAGIDNVH